MDVDSETLLPRRVVACLQSVPAKSTGDRGCLEGNLGIFLLTEKGRHETFKTVIPLKLEEFFDNKCESKAGADS